ncbi:aldose 1-epimerase [Xenophilus aerolatus]|nr:aldose 1-epimerase [Xenophilus aerolatus]
MSGSHGPDGIRWLAHAGQRLGLLPTLGGGVAAWQLARPEGGWLDLWRPWDGLTPDMYRLASFAMVPWSNRISGGGFAQAQRHHPMQPNRQGEPYPIHGDGWLQPWEGAAAAPGVFEMHLRSERHGGNPYRYRAVQRFALVEGGLDQSVEVTNTGDEALPFGLGLHPWFPRTPHARVQAPVGGVWLSGADPLPVGHSTELAPDWDLRQGIGAEGSFIDNGFTDWNGEAAVEWPEHGLRVTLSARDGAPGAESPTAFCLVYRPPVGDAFCFEPITHPIDAFHLDGRPGLRVLAPGESMVLHAAWRVQAMPSPA